jgi:hypothetical protein
VVRLFGLQLHVLSTEAHFVRLDLGQRVIKSGETSTFCFMVLSGSMQARQTNAADCPVPDPTLSPLSPRCAADLLGEKVGQRDNKEL